MRLDSNGKQMNDRDSGQMKKSIQSRQETAGLVRQMIDGNQEAFDALMTMYYSKALHIAYLISGNRPDSEDIVQETFVLCWVNRKKIREPEYFETWLYKTLTREAWRICKRARKEPPVEDVFGEEKACPVNVMEEAMRNWEAREILRAVKELPVKQRTVIVLYYYNQMSTKEIARVTNCLEGTVKSRLYTARASLKQVLADETYAFRREIPQ